MGEAWGRSIGLCTIQSILLPRGVWSEAAYCLRLSAHAPPTPPPEFRPLSGGCSPAGVWGGQPDSSLRARCPLAVWEKCLPSSAAVGAEGAGGRGAMLEAGARGCLLTTVPLHDPAKGSLPRVYTGRLKNPETTRLCVRGQKGAVGSPPLFLSCFCGGHGNYCREQLLRGYDMRATLSASCSSRSRLLCSDEPRGIRPQQE